MKTPVCVLVALVCCAAIASGQEGFRRRCPDFCPAIYEPRCGYNGFCLHEFSNSCELSANNCRGYGRFLQVDLYLCRLAQEQRGRGRLRLC